MTEKTEAKKNLQILIADDYQPSLLSIKNYLKDILDDMGFKGFSIDTAENGKIALEKTLEKISHEDHYDLILTDYEMPDLNGMEFYQGLCQNPEQQKKVIFITGKTSELAEIFNSQSTQNNYQSPLILDKNNFFAAGKIDKIIKAYLE